MRLDDLLRSHSSKSLAGERCATMDGIKHQHPARHAQLAKDIVAEFKSQGLSPTHSQLAWLQLFCLGAT